MTGGRLSPKPRLRARPCLKHRCLPLQTFSLVLLLRLLRLLLLLLCSPPLALLHLLLLLLLLLLLCSPPLALLHLPVEPALAAALAAVKRRQAVETPALQHTAGCNRHSRHSRRSVVIRRRALSFGQAGRLAASLP